MLGIKSAELECVCGITSKLPKTEYIQIAFAGKSNVGKSSLINSLLNRKSLARTSQSPGKTQTINYYLVNRNLYFVDLPGYGYAKVSEKVKMQWGKMIERYLETTDNIASVLLLIDIRHEPSANDVMMYDWVVSRGYEPVIIATKADKIKRSQLQKHVKMIKDKLGMPKDGIIIPYSSLSKQGREELLTFIERLGDEYGA